MLCSGLRGRPPSSLLPSGMEGVQGVSLCLLPTQLWAAASGSCSEWNVKVGPRLCYELLTLPPLHAEERVLHWELGEVRAPKMRDWIVYLQIASQIKFCSTLKQRLCRGKEASILLSGTLRHKLQGVCSRPASEVQLLCSAHKRTGNSSPPSHSIV